jgi:hypothetical protein
MQKRREVVTSLQQLDETNNSKEYEGGVGFGAY